jgi:hypothetical protein
MLPLPQPPQLVVMFVCRGRSDLIDMTVRRQVSSRIPPFDEEDVNGMKFRDANPNISDSER